VDRSARHAGQGTEGPGQGLVGKTNQLRIYKDLHGFFFLGHGPAFRYCEDEKSVLILFFKDPSDLNASNSNSLVASNLRALLNGLLGEDALPRFLAKFRGWVNIFGI
jgi:hypothetical protein